MDKDANVKEIVIDNTETKICTVCNENKDIIR